MICNECELIELEILSEPDVPLELELDFEGEVVSGSSGEEYQNGYDKGLTDGYSDGREAGYTKGYKDGYDECKAEGDSLYDTSWNHIQQNGERQHYSYSFSGNAWDDTTFRPKYDMKASMCVGMFQHAAFTDLVAILEQQHVILDTSRAQDLRDMFRESYVTRVGIIDASFTEYNYMSAIFYACKSLHTIEKIIFSERPNLASNAYANMFYQCTSLVNIKAEGAIRYTIDLKYSPLSVESAKSIISCLVNYAGAKNEFTYTITFSPTTWGYLDAEGNASPNGNTWREYINDLGWNAS